MNFDNIYKAWLAVGADVAGLEWENFVKHLSGSEPEQAEQQEPVAKIVSTAPERIWLDLGFDPAVEDEVSFDDLFEATWSHDNATGNGIEYVRADLARPQAREPLTDDEIAEIAATPAAIPGSYVHSFARAIEAAHGITGEKK